MTTMELNKKLENLENIEAMIDEIRKATDENAVLEILHQNGLDVTAEEITAFCSLEEGELDADQLDYVSGGAKCSYDSWVHKVIWKFLQFVGIADKNSCPVSQY